MGSLPSASAALRDPFAASRSAKWTVRTVSGAARNKFRMVPDGIRSVQIPMRTVRNWKRTVRTALRMVRIARGTVRNTRGTVRIAV